MFPVNFRRIETELVCISSLTLTHIRTFHVIGKQSSNLGLLSGLANLNGVTYPVQAYKGVRLGLSTRSLSATIGDFYVFTSYNGQKLTPVFWAY